MMRISWRDWIFGCLTLILTIVVLSVLFFCVGSLIIYGKV